MLPELAAAGAKALKVEGRQRGRVYVSRVVSDFRKAIDGAGQFGELDDMTEGARNTEGVYQKPWH